MRIPWRVPLAAAALAIALSSCAMSADPVVAEGDPASSPSVAGRDASTPSPSPSPNDLVAEEPPADLDTDTEVSASDGGETSPSPSALPDLAWPLVDVPSAPAPRLAVTCDELLGASRAVGISAVAPPLTAQAIGVRQAGGTVCAFAIDVPGGRAEALLTMAADLGTPRIQQVGCTAHGGEGDTVRCAGEGGTSSGAVRIAYAMPPGSDLGAGTAEAQSLLDAAVAVLQAEPVLGPVPSIHPDSMGADAGGCSPTSTQRETVFGQFQLGQNPDVYGSTLSIMHTESELDERVGAWGCWWWLGWQGISVEVVPGGAWAVDELGRDSVTVNGAVAAVRTERTVIEYRSAEESVLSEIAIVASARGSVIIVRAAVAPRHVEYFDRTLPLMAAAMIATQP